MKDTLVSIFPDVKLTSDPPAFKKLSYVLDAIREVNESITPVITEIRADRTKQTKRKTLKATLPAIIFSGICSKAVANKSKNSVSYRTDASISKHTGIAVLDFDNMRLSDVSKLKEVLRNDKRVISFFMSPSGPKGLKALFRIPPDTSMHRAHYRALLAEFSDFNPDPTGINISRACYMSHDPEIYINYEAEEYTDFLSEPDKDTERIEVDIPEDVLTDYRKLELAARMIDRAPDGQKHHILLKASYLMGGFVASGQVAESEARAMLRHRILARDIDNKNLAFKTIEDGLREGKFKPLYELEELERAFEIHLSKEDYKDERRGFSFLTDPISTDQDMYTYIREGLKMGLKTGYPHLDEHFRFKENNFEVVLGHDNTGKSTFVWFLQVLAAAQHGWKWIIYSPENQMFRVKKQLIDFVLGRDARGVDAKRVDYAKRFVDKHFIFIRKDKVYTLYDILDYSRLLVSEREGIKGLMVDPYNSLALDYKGKGAGLNPYEYHIRALSEIRIFSEGYCSTWVNAHSVTGARRNMFDADRNLLRPQKDDIDQGAIWANRCDDFFVVHRKVRDKEEWMWTEFHVDKVKDIETGGRLTYHDQPVRLRFSHYSDFVDENNFSPMIAWRREFFGDTHVEQLPLIDPNDAFN